MTFSPISKPVNDVIKRKDLHQQVTDTIIEQLEAGTVPWQQSWTGNSSILSIPGNYITQKQYRGVNILLLWSSAINRGYKSDRWATLKQWNSKQEYVRQDEMKNKTLIVYYDFIEKENDEGEKKKVPFLKYSYVYNKEQLQSYIPEHEPATSLKPIFERIAAIDTFVDNTDAIIEHVGHQPCYIPSLDRIQMPHPDAFKETPTASAAENYYSTLFHEMVHLSGSEKRLNRKCDKKFGDKDYAKEELIAKLGAAFLSAEFQIGSKNIPDHASYLAHWIAVLKENKHIILSSAAEASKAVDFFKNQQPVTPKQ